jgi:hypothetical protein
MGQDGAAGIHDAQHVGVENFVPLAGFLFGKRPDRPLNPGVGDQRVDAAPCAGHPFDGGAYLFEIADIGSQTQRRAFGVFDFQLGDVKLGLVSAEEANPGSGVRETYSEAFADSTSGSGNQDSCILRGTQTVILYPSA